MHRWPREDVPRAPGYANRGEPGVKMGKYKAFNALGFTWVTLCALITFGIPLILGAAVDPTTAGLVAALIVVGLSIVLFFLDSRLFFVYWISLVLLQNVVSGLWYSSSLQESVPLMVTEAKSVALATGGILALGQIFTLIRAHMWLAVGLALYLAGILVNVSSLDVVALANLRNFLTPLAILFLAISQAMRCSADERDDFVRTILTISAAWLALGTLGELLVGTAEWRQLFSADAIGGLNSLSVTTSLFGFEFSRVGGVLIEPVNNGYVAASVIAVLLVHRYYMARSYATVLFATILACSVFALFFSSTRNPLLMFVVGILAVYCLRVLRLHPAATLMLSWVAAFFATLSYVVLVAGPQYALSVWSEPLESVVDTESTTVHMAGLIAGFKSLAEVPLGHGLGSGGNFLRIFDDEMTWTEWLTTGSESSWGTMAYQLGILAILGFVLVLFATGHMLGGAGTVLLAVWSAAALFTEHFFGPIGSSVILVATGFVAEVAVRDRQRPLVDA